MARFLVTLCDDTGCNEISRSNSEESAKRKACRAAKKAAKKFKGQQVPDGAVTASVYSIDRGLVSDDAIFVAEESYGAPHQRKRRKPATE